MNSAIAILNQSGGVFLDFARSMFWQSSVLVLVLLALDFGLRHRVRAAMRHGLWLVLLVKLVLPTDLALPTSPAWWWSRATAVPVVPDPVIAPNYPPAPNDLPLPDVPMPAWTVLPPRPALTPAALSLLVAVVVSLGLLGWLLRRWRQVVQASRTAVPAAALAQCLGEARELANLRSPVPVRLTDDTLSPAVCGLFRPVILLPRALADTLPPEQLRAVLLHELMHLRRGDVWVNFVQALLQIFYWWHPLVWVANARIRRVREEAVDEAVMVALRGEADSYAPTLLAVAKFALHRPRASLGLLGIMESRSALRQRIERLVTLPVPRRAGLGVGGALGLVAFSTVALPMGEAPPLPAQPDNGHATTATNTPDVNQLLIDAMTLYEAHQWDAARLKLAQVLRADPANPAALYYWRLVHTPAAAPATATNLFMRTFRVRPEIFLREIGLTPAASNRTNSPGSQTNPAELGQHLQFYFHTLGVDLLPPKAVFFNDRLGLLFVKATAGDLDKIERAMVKWNNTNAPPVLAPFKLSSLGATNNPSLAAYWNLPPAGSNMPPWSPTNPSSARITGILSNPNFQVAIHGLEQRTGLEKLAEPEVTTTSGGQTRSRISANDVNRLDPPMLEGPVPHRLQLHIKARFIEVTGDFTNPPALAHPPSGPNELAILSGDQVRPWLHQLAARPGATILAEPEVTTTSGRQTQLRATEIQSILVGVNPKALTPPGLSRAEVNNGPGFFKVENLELGPIFDVVPRVLADGCTINMRMVATEIEFPGYDKPAKKVRVYVDDLPTNGPPAITTVPAPRFNLREFRADVNLYDNQALLLTQPIDPRTGQPFEATGKKAKHLLVLAIVTLVDEAGNRVHADAELPFTRQRVPPQPPQNEASPDDRPFTQPAPSPRRAGP